MGAAGTRFWSDLKWQPAANSCVIQPSAAAGSITGNGASGYPQDRETPAHHIHSLRRCRTDRVLEVLPRQPECPSNDVVIDGSPLANEPLHDYDDAGANQPGDNGNPKERTCWRSFLRAALLSHGRLDG